MQLPTVRAIEDLHHKYAPSEKVFQDIWQHCHIVKQIAEWCIDNRSISNVDRDLVAVGCLLHDVGVYRLYDTDGKTEVKSYITHGVLGYNLLKEEDFSEKLCRFASHHTGVGITSKDVHQYNLPMPVADYLSETPEERLVMYADKFHSKGPSQFNNSEWIRNHLVSKFGDEKGVIFDEMLSEFGLPPVDKIAKPYKQKVRQA